MRMVAMDEKDSGVIYVVKPEVDVTRWLVKVSTFPTQITTALTNCPSIIHYIFQLTALVSILVLSSLFQ